MLPLAYVPVAYAADSPQEAALKVGYLLNFARFTSWPSDKFAAPNAPFQLCLLLPDLLGPVADETLNNKTVSGHPVLLRRAERPEALRGCHLVYISNRSNDILAPALSRLVGANVLTVHEASAARSDGVIRLFEEDRRLRFEINQGAAARESLTIAGGLLVMAQRVNQ